VELILDLAGRQQPMRIGLSTRTERLANFRFPLDLPLRKPPGKKQPSQTASEFAQQGWQDFLFARFPAADDHFRKALEKDSKSTEALAGLAYLNLDRDAAAAASAAQAALAVAPDNGRVAFALAAAEYGQRQNEPALKHAWEATLDPATAIAGRALAAKALIRQRRFEQAIVALSAIGPWQADPLCRNLLAFALLETEHRESAVSLAKTNLALDPLDQFAASVLFFCQWRQREGNVPTPAWLKNADEMSALQLAAELQGLGQVGWGRLIVNRFMRAKPQSATGALVNYFDSFLIWHSMHLDFDDCDQRAALEPLARAKLLPAAGVFPHLPESESVLRWALKQKPDDGKAALYLGHLLFHLGRHAEGREMWRRAVELGAEPVIAYRALGMAALTLDDDPDTARKYLTQAHAADRADAIVARDLARVLFKLADKEDSEPSRKQLWTEARDGLKAAFESGKGRSDFVSLLARTQSRLGEFAETARMLDQVRVTVWEGSREVHDLFEDAHLALGKAHVEASRPAEALAEFNRALEYPANLATGKLENTREAHIHYLRGNALAALGQKQAAIEAWQQAAREPASDDAKKEEARKKAQEALEKARP
jgi:tetratricopeptide (TPR) repeat protein